MGDLNERDRSGTQSIERAVTLLREISTRGHFGWQLSDLAARCHLGKSTAHRMLACLLREGLVRQRPTDRHYMPGPLLFELGLSLPELGDLQYIARSRLATLAKRNSAVAFLFFRSGDDFVCAVRVGSRDLNVLTSPGTRRPLITSAGGVAMLLEMPVPDAREIIRRNFASLKEAGYSKARARNIRTMLERTHAARFAINAGDIVPGVNAFALALRNSSGAPFAAVSLAGPSATFSLKRAPEIRSTLESTVQELQAEVR
jgi:DNA-binding IclR family transcriptional regulator